MQRVRRIYYGWWIVLTLAVTETVSYGALYYSFSVFVKPLERAFGWSGGAVSLAFTLSLLISGVVGLGVGRLVDRRGPRVIMSLGSPLAVAALVAFSRVNSLPGLYVAWSAIGVASAAVLYEPAFAAVTTWFDVRRGRALAILTFIAGFASVIFIPLTGLLVEEGGWRQAAFTLAIIVAVVTIPLHILVLRRRPEDLGLVRDGAGPSEGQRLPRTLPGRSWDVRRACRSPGFMLVTIGLLLNALGGIAISVHLVAFLQEARYGAGFAAAAGGLVGLASLPGRLVFNWLGDRVSRASLLGIILVTQGVAVLFLIGQKNALWVYAFVLLYGSVFGAITPLRAGVMGDYFGRGHYATIMAVQNVFITAGRGLGPLAAGILRDVTGSYILAFWLVIAVSCASAAAIYAGDLFMRRALRLQETAEEPYPA